MRFIAGVSILLSSCSLVWGRPDAPDWEWPDYNRPGYVTYCEYMMEPVPHYSLGRDFCAMECMRNDILTDFCPEEKFELVHGDVPTFLECNEKHTYPECMNTRWVMIDFFIREHPWATSPNDYQTENGETLIHPPPEYDPGSEARRTKAHDLFLEWAQ